MPVKYNRIFSMPVIHTIIFIPVKYRRMVLMPLVYTSEVLKDGFNAIGLYQ